MLPLAISLAAILSAADYITEHLVPKNVMANQKVISFAAGVAIAYILLHLFPEVSVLSLSEGRFLFLYALIGFTLTHLMERFLHISHHVPKFLQDNNRVHLIFFFLYNFIIGILLTKIAAQGKAQALLFFIPFLLYVSVEILPQQFHLKTLVGKVFYAFAPLLGAAIATIFIPVALFAAEIFAELLTMATGMLLYIVIRQTLPSNRDSSPFAFVLGVVLYAAVIGAVRTW